MVAVMVLVISHPRLIVGFVILYWSSDARYHPAGMTIGGRNTENTPRIARMVRPVRVHFAHQSSRRSFQARCAELAATAKTPQLRATLLDLSKSWVRLAESVEKTYALMDEDDVDLKKSA
jgi:hypothetical protein